MRCCPLRRQWQCSQWSWQSLSMLMCEGPDSAEVAAPRLAWKKKKGAGFWLSRGPNRVWPIPWHFSIDIFCKLELRVGGLSLKLRGWSQKRKWSALNLLIILSSATKGLALTQLGVRRSPTYMKINEPPPEKTWTVLNGSRGEVAADGEF